MRSLQACRNNDKENISGNWTHVYILLNIHHWGQQKLFSGKWCKWRINFLELSSITTTRARLLLWQAWLKPTHWEPAVPRDTGCRAGSCPAPPPSCSAADSCHQEHTKATGELALPGDMSCFLLAGQTLSLVLAINVPSLVLRTALRMPAEDDVG